MPLTKLELTAAADCADHYPSGKGWSFFTHKQIDTARGAARHLSKHPDDVKFG